MLSKKIILTNVFYKVLNVGIVVLANIVLSRLLGVSGYGQLSLLIANATIFNLFSSVGADSSITYHASSEKLSRNSIFGLLVICLLFQLLVSVLFEIITYSITGHLLLLKTNELNTAWIGILYLLSISLIEKYSGLLNAEKKFTLLSKGIFIGNLLLLIAFVFFYYYDRADSLFQYFKYYTLISVLQAVIIIGTYHFILKKALHLRMPSAKEFKIFYTYGAIVFCTNAFQFLAYRVDYWILDHYKGDQELGWYSLAMKLVQFFWVVPLVLSGMIFPLIADEKGKEHEDKISLIIRMMNLINIIVAACAFFIIPFILPILFGEDYHNSIFVFQLLLPGVVLFCNATILAAYFAGKRKLRINFFGSLLCFVSILSLDLLFIPAYGMKGAVWANNISYIATAVYFVIVYCYTERKAVKELLIPHKADWKNLLSILKEKK